MGWETKGDLILNILGIKERLKNKSSYFLKEHVLNIIASKFGTQEMLHPHKSVWYYLVHLKLHVECINLIWEETKDSLL